MLQERDREEGGVGYRMLGVRDEYMELIYIG